MSELAKHDDKTAATALSFTRQMDTIHCLDLTKEENQLLFLQAIQGDAEPLANHIGEPFDVCNCIVKAVEFVDEVSGEVTPGFRTVLIGPKNELWVSSSNGVFESVRNLCTVFGVFPWVKPRKLVLRQRPIKGGKHRMYY